MGKNRYSYWELIVRDISVEGLLNDLAEAEIGFFSPRLQDEVTLCETERFLDRVFGGSVSMMLSAMTAGNQLTGEEIDALYEVLRKAEDAAQDKTS